ncbi:MAG: hypothetical protein U5L04_12515 [Trueperaceae bacterium]|nr:hypothetical protein [Trueperaceae bacterium]
MTKTSLNSTYTLGAILIALGALILVSNSGLVASFDELFGSLLFFAAATFFLYKVRHDPRGSWWALIPGFALLGLGVAAMRDDFAGSYFLSITGLGFAMVYLLDNRRWWALIPGGALVTLGLVAGADVVFAGWDVGGALFFLGLAATFGLLYALPRSRGRQAWALYPAIALAVLAMFTVSFMGGPLGAIWPLLLVGVGVYLLLNQNGAAGRRTRGPAPQQADTLPNSVSNDASGSVSDRDSDQTPDKLRKTSSS